MKLRQSKKAWMIVTFVIILAGFVKIGFLDNPELLCVVAEGFDEPSFCFYLTLNRIYALAEKDNFSKKLIQHLSTGNNANLHDIYIRVLGVIGEETALHELFRTYQRHQSDAAHKAIVYYTVTSIGMIGSEEMVPFLETLLEKPKELKIQVDELTIANALYLTTGIEETRVAEFFNGKKHKLSPEQIAARRVIASSKGRKRSYDEMLVLDKIYRPATEH